MVSQLTIQSLVLVCWVMVVVIVYVGVVRSPLQGRVRSIAWLILIKPKRRAPRLVRKYPAAGRSADCW